MNDWRREAGADVVAGRSVTAAILSRWHPRRAGGGALDRYLDVEIPCRDRVGR